jgi:hypothetical protein
VISDVSSAITNLQDVNIADHSGRKVGNLKLNLALRKDLGRRRRRVIREIGRGRVEELVDGGIGERIKPRDLPPLELGLNSLGKPIPKELRLGLRLRNLLDGAKPPLAMAEAVILDLRGRYGDPCGHGFVLLLRELAGGESA